MIIFSACLAAAYTFALWIFCASGYRDWLFSEAIDASPVLKDKGFVAALAGAPSWAPMADLVLAGTLAGTGLILVLGAFARLGITGTYLGGKIEKKKKKKKEKE